jgi:hypothetical protein
MASNRSSVALLAAGLIIGWLDLALAAGPRPALRLPQNTTTRQLQQLHQKVALLEKRLAALTARTGGSAKKRGKGEQPSQAPRTPIGTDRTQQSELDKRLKTIEARLAAVEQHLQQTQAALAQLTTLYSAHKHTVNKVPFGYITKTGFLGSVPANALVPYIAPHKLSKNGTATPALVPTSTPK